MTATACLATRASTSCALPRRHAAHAEAAVAAAADAARTRYVRHTLTGTALGTELDTVDGTPPELALTAHALSDSVGLMAGAFARPVQAMRGPQRVREDGLDAVILIAHRGGEAASCNGMQRERVLPGQLTQGTLARPGHMFYDQPGDLMVLLFDRGALRRRLPRLDADAVRPLPPDAPGAALMQSYARLLLQGPCSAPAWAGAQPASGAGPSAGDAAASAAPAALLQQAGEHLADLAALVLGARGDAADAARAGGGRVARLATLRADVARACRDPGLSVVQVAQRHHMSVRQVQRLFEEEGGTFTAYVQDCRLAQVRRALVDPACAHRLVATLAYEAGFSDLAAFNRLFKRRFGATPTQLRAEAFKEAVKKAAP